MNKRHQKQIEKIFTSILKQVLSTSDDQITNDTLTNKIIKIQSSNKYNEFCKKFAKALSKAGLSSNRSIWRQYYEAARKLNSVSLPTTYTEYERDLLKKVIEKNFKMIKSIPSQMLTMFEKKYSTTLFEQVANGSIPLTSFKRQLMSHGVKRSKVIARTEISKLQQAITEIRALDLGSICYEWRSSNDKRTRQSHKDMNGVIVCWRTRLEERPLLDGLRGNAGEFPNCRCDSRPIFDESDLTKSSYKFYDYMLTKIVKLSKRDLLERLKAEQSTQDVQRDTQ